VTPPLVVQTAWLGDAVLTTPLLVALAEVHGPVDVVTSPAAVPLFATHPAVRAVLPYDKRGADRGVAGLRRMARRVRAGRYPAAYLAQGSLRSALLTRLAGIPRRVALADAPGRWLCTDLRPRHGTHEAERLCALADGAGPAPLTLGITAEDHAAAEAALARAGIATPFVALAPGSARANKRWPFYGALAAALSDDVSIVVIGARGEGTLLSPPAGPPARPPAESARRTADLTGLPVRVTAAVLARADVAVANDSLALHLTQAVGTPVVALFGPTHPRLGFGPRGPHDVVLGRDLACRPCSTHGGRRCPLVHHQCLRTLDVATVTAAVRRTRCVSEAACG